MPTHLLVTRGFHTAFGDELERVASETGLELTPLILENERGSVLDASLCANVDIAFMSGDLYPGNFRGFLESLNVCPNLKWVQLFYVGIQGPLFQPLFERGVTLTSAAGASAQVIAQTAIGGVLILSRPFRSWMEAQREHLWRQVGSNQDEAPPDLCDQTMVVVGLGAIGSEIAKLAKALGMRVIGVRRSPGPAEHVDDIVHPSKLDSVLPEANWLSLACPLTDETRGLIDARRFGLLPEKACVANVARGAVIDEDALIEGLQAGRLGGAYLDVFAREPLPEDSPLWDMPNVIITPHNATASASKYRRECEVFFDNLRRWATNQPLRNVVTDL